MIIAPPAAWSKLVTACAVVPPPLSSISSLSESKSPAFLVVWVTERFGALEKVPSLDLDLDFEVVALGFEDNLEPREMEIGLGSEDDVEGGLVEGMAVGG